LALLNPLDVTGAYTALATLNVAEPGDHYTDRALQTSVLFLNAAGVLRLAHVNDQPVESWGPVLPDGARRRPDADTLDEYLQAILAQDDLDSTEQPRERPADRVGQIQPDGIITQALSQSLAQWAAAGLFQDPVWHFDGHTIEYTGRAKIGKTLHGTKHFSVKAVDEYCLFNHIPGLTCYFPTSVSYEQALRQMITLTQATLPPDQRIRKLAFDKEGWNANLLQWLVAQDILPFTWVKDTPTNRALLTGVSPDEFVEVGDGVTVGKSEQEHRVKQVADVDLTFQDLGTCRVVILETDRGTRLGIFTTARRPTAAPLDDESVMTTIAVLEAMRCKQRIENSFKVRSHEMDSDALPTHQVHSFVQAKPYDLTTAQAQATRAEKRLAKYQAQQQRHQDLMESGQIDQHEFKTLTARTTRLQNKTQNLKDRWAQDIAQAKTDPVTGQTTIERVTQVLDVRKLTLLNLFKDHAFVCLHLLAHLLGLDGAGPERLRREFFAYGDRIEFDHTRRIMTVFAQRFPRARTQQAYERLCAQLNDCPVTFMRDGVTYRVRFSW
jgi:hypothetical protein